MTNKRSFGIAGAMLALTICLAVAADRVREQKYHQAVDLLESKGDVKGAIKLFEEAAKSPDRNLAARALLYLGSCYEKLGQDGAQKAYERIVREFGDQVELTAKARGKLAEMSGASTGKSSTLTLRQIWAGPDVDANGGISGDGKLLSFTEHATGDLMLRDLTRGENRRLTHNKDAQGPNAERAGCSRISPDGKWVAYAWRRGNHSDLRIIGTDGTMGRVFYNDPTITWVNYLVWAPDNVHVAADVSRPDRPAELTLISSADGKDRILRKASPNYRWGITFSPDMRYVAYSTTPNERTRQRDVFLLRVEDGKETPLIAHPATDGVIGWSPDGKQFLFLSDRSGKQAAYAAPFADGKITGPPVYIQDTYQEWILGQTRQGAVYFAIWPWDSDVYVASIDPATGRAVSEPMVYGSRFLGRNSQPDWSSDGKLLVYESHRGPFPSAGTGKVLTILDDAGRERDLMPQLADWYRPLWSMDGRWLLVYSNTSESGKPRISRVDSQTGEARQIVEGKGISHLGWTEGGRRILYVSVERKAVLSRDVETGDEKVIAAPDISRPSDPGQRLLPAITRDGTLLALVEAKGVMNIPLNGGAPHLLFPTQPEERLTSLAWAPDGRHLLFVRQRKHQKGELWQVPAAGGQAWFTGLKMDGMAELAFHPDGHRIAFCSRPDPMPEVWVMENLLRSIRASR